MLALSAACAALPFVMAGSIASAPPLSEFIATQHFQPCYNVSMLPSLLDGAVQSARLGSTSFKFGLKGTMSDMYPYNNDDAPWPENPTSLADVVASSQVQKLLTNKLGTNFTTVTLWAYAVGEPDSPFCGPTWPIPPEKLAVHTQQLEDLTVSLMTLQSTVESYWIESWENDWATRCGPFGPTHVPSDEVRQAYAAWLTARQTGVERGRKSFCRMRKGRLSVATTNSPVDCDDTAAIVAAAPTNVYLGAEVNLVADCLTNTSCGNIVREILPTTPLDYVSYSSYDTMRLPQLADALDLISSQHNRTLASPERPVFITEFGLPLTTADPTIVKQVVDNVLKIGREKDLARVHWWQTINNEKLGNGGVCSAKDPPNHNPATQNGFWTTKPDGTLSSVGVYLQDIIAGRQPFPS